MGVPDDQISVVGYGEEHASTAGKNDDHQRHRRVDFKVF
jgi:outer membrane protein OmpA-like peptidoglycan-associated protein